MTPPPPPIANLDLLGRFGSLGCLLGYSADSEVSGKDDPNCRSKQAFHPILRQKTGLCKWNVYSILQIHSYVIEKCKK